MNALRLNVYIFVCVVFFGVDALGRDTDEFYYWKEYEGEIPSDAVPAGINSRANKIYIGHILHSYLNETGTNITVIVPGQIDEVERKIFYVYHHTPYAQSRNAKILCSPHPERFKWLKSNTEGIKFLRQRHLVQGGADDGYPLLIGRIFKEGRSSVGKVTLYYKYDGLGYVDLENEKAYLVKTYEVLSYNDRCDY